MATLVLLSCHLNEIPPSDVNRALCTVKKMNEIAVYIHSSHNAQIDVFRLALDRHCHTIQF